MPQGNDSKILAVLFQLKQAQKCLSYINSPEDNSSMSMLLRQLTDIITTHDFNDEEYSAAPIADDEVTELNREAQAFTRKLASTLFKNHNSLCQQEGALKALEQFKDTADASEGLKL